MIGPFLRVFGSLAQIHPCLRFASNLAVREREHMVQVLSARLRKLRPAEECGGTSEVFLCYGPPQKKARRRVKSENVKDVHFNAKMALRNFARGPRSLEEMFDPG